jgi:hypothetical protein
MEKCAGSSRRIFGAGGDSVKACGRCSVATRRRGGRHGVLTIGIQIQFFYSSAGVMRRLLEPRIRLVVMSMLLERWGVMRRSPGIR